MTTLMPVSVIFVKVCVTKLLQLWRQFGGVVFGSVHIHHVYGVIQAEDAHGMLVSFSIHRQPYDDATASYVRYSFLQSRVLTDIHKDTINCMKGTLYVCDE